MSQGGSDLDMNNVAMDPNDMYYSSLNDLSGGLAAPQGAQNGLDTSITGMLEDGLLDNFDSMDMTLDVNSLDNGTSSKIFPPLNATSSHAEMENREDKIASLGDKRMTMIGAGPLPTGFGVQSNVGGGSTLTEFTKRRNWSQRIVEELKDFLHILTPDGRIVYLSPSVKQLTGYTQEELIGKFVVDFIHPDDSGIFVREFNESIASGNPLRFFYRFRKKDGAFTIFESHGHPHLTSGAAAFGPNNAAGFCRGFFMMARPYPAKNTALLDSFLEHKIENARLMRRIEDLKREEAEEEADAAQSWGRKDNRFDNLSEETGTTGASSITAAPVQIANSVAMVMPPPAKPTLTRQNLEDVNASRKPDSINDKMARYEGASHRADVEMLTGLRYQEGERSQGISTGHQSPALIRGDAGIAIVTDKETRANDKRKKIKLPDEYVCTDCGRSYPLDLIRSIAHLYRKGRWIPPSGEKDQVGPRLFATHAVFDGRRRGKRNLVKHQGPWLDPKSVSLGHYGLFWGATD
ncbi:hypothetical protein BJ875DRAFT_529048 [Amylocarpus encephaloides]|uniref:PAS domain-containing protein n=1 Tax=Amylocarpus encephaloides TaxID=45428 RepID=A0A9P7YLK8_9HELO|nr:hypothetical protein BJ875DRAFT_529048 [Amylocarpus encephaloides]